eukprot:Skav212281  [mRNA]  locus=scaffold732:359615:361018:- [translate_table: standard]
MVALSRRLTVCLVGHFVDDFVGMNLSHNSSCSFETFRDLHQALGLDMKPGKAQEPKQTQKVLGVILSTGRDSITVAACPERARKMTDLINETLNKNYLDGPTAQRMAGKLAFLTSTFFGGLGRAALQPLYARGHGLGEQTNNQLTFALRAALELLRHLINTTAPRVIPTKVNYQDSVIVYTDAYFELGSQGVRQQPPSTWKPGSRTPTQNGWGLVIRFPSKVFYAYGRVPCQYLDRLTSRRAYIYMLEVLAAVITVTHFHDILPSLQTFFIDNMAGKQALVKGYGKDPNVNALITAFWALASKKLWWPHLQYVRSALNSSDAVSRHDLTHARAQGWQEVQLDIEYMLDIVVNFAMNGSKDIEDLTQRLLQCHLHRAGWFESARFGTGNGQSNHPSSGQMSLGTRTKPLESVEKKSRATCTKNRDVVKHQDAHGHGVMSVVERSCGSKEKPSATHPCSNLLNFPPASS